MNLSNHTTVMDFLYTLDFYFSTVEIKNMNNELIEKFVCNKGNYAEVYDNIVRNYGKNCIFECNYNFKNDDISLIIQ